VNFSFFWIFSNCDFWYSVQVGVGLQVSSLLKKSKFGLH